MRLCSSVFCFGDYATHCFGLMRLAEDGLVQGYAHEREHRWQMVDGELRFLLRGTDHVTSRLRLVCEEPLLFHGASTADNNRLYLRELLCLESLRQLPTDPSRPPLLINTTPKSGTYWLRRAFVDLGFQPTDLHVGNGGLDDNRGLPDEESLHRDPWLRRTLMPLSLLAPALPAGSVTVGHVNDAAVIDDLARRGVAMIQVVRDLRAVIESFFHFKLRVVDPAHDRDPSWRRAGDPAARFLGFLSCYRETELEGLAQCFRCFASRESPITLRYEDLVADRLDPGLAPAMARILGREDGLEAFRRVLRTSYRQPTSTLRQEDAIDPGERQTIRELAAAFVAGSELAELNRRFGYGAEPAGSPGERR